MTGLRYKKYGYSYREIKSNKYTASKTVNYLLLFFCDFFNSFFEKHIIIGEKAQILIKRVKYGTKSIIIRQPRRSKNTAALNFREMQNANEATNRAEKCTRKKRETRSRRKTRHAANSGGMGRNPSLPAVGTSRDSPGHVTD
jgi:hypothetical protein